MSRDEWVEAGAQASATYWEDGAPDDLDRGLAAAVIDAVAPLVAAERDAALARERERVAVLSVEVAELRRGLESCRMRAALLRKALDEAQDAEETLDELRAQVEALSRAPLSPLDWVLRADVLALLDGGGDE